MNALSLHLLMVRLTDDPTMMKDTQFPVMCIQCAMIRGIARIHVVVVAMAVRRIGITDDEKES